MNFADYKAEDIVDVHFWKLSHPRVSNVKLRQRKHNLR